MGEWGIILMVNQQIGWAMGIGRGLIYQTLLFRWAGDSVEKFYRCVELFNGFSFVFDFF
jgi:hypothetical protein